MTLADLGSENDAEIVTSPDRLPDWLADAGAVVFDVDKITLVDLFDSPAAGPMVAGLDEPPAMRAQEIAWVYDLNDTTLVEALAS